MAEEVPNEALSGVQPVSSEEYKTAGWEQQLAELREINPNGSMCAVESIILPDGRVLGKMCHTERLTENCFVNVDKDKEQLLLKSGVEHFL